MLIITYVCALIEISIEGNTICVSVAFSLHILSFRFFIFVFVLMIINRFWWFYKWVSENGRRCCCCFLLREGGTSESSTLMRKQNISYQFSLFHFINLNAGWSTAHSNEILTSNCSYIKLNCVCLLLFFRFPHSSFKFHR